jgi:hypothetical protein
MGLTPSDRAELSERGCGRATSYAESNKIVTVDGTTHAGWLDVEEAGEFRVRLRSYDHGSGEWGPARTIGPAEDNHGGPALAVDGSDHLHVVYGPHHGPMRYRRSVNPTDASAWTDETNLGEDLTYPTLVVAPDDTLVLLARQHGRGDRWRVVRYERPPEGDWQGPTPVLESGAEDYARFGTSLAWDEADRLHLACRFFELREEREEFPGDSEVVGYLRSDDAGRSWQRLDGTTVDRPARPTDVTAIENDPDGYFEVGTVAVHEGRVHVGYSDRTTDPRSATLATLVDGEWRRRSLDRELPEPVTGWDVHPSTLASTADGLYVALTVGQPWEWGDDSGEVAVLRTRDGGETFDSTLVSSIDPDRAHWQPSLERPTGHNEVERPGMLYTDGPPGGGLEDVLSNAVRWVRF